jgi:hypothetical protein
MAQIVQTLLLGESIRVRKYRRARSWLLKHLLGLCPGIVETVYEVAMLSALPEARRENAGQQNTFNPCIRKSLGTRLFNPLLCCFRIMEGH